MPKNGPSCAAKLDDQPSDGTREGYQATPMHRLQRDALEQPKQVRHSAAKDNDNRLC